jgi:hypothetical protein
MKHEENSGFTSFDFVTLIFSFAVIVAVSAPIIQRNFQADPNIQVAQNQAFSLSQSLLSPKMLEIMAARSNGEEFGSRSIASVSSDDSKIPNIDMASIKSHLKNGEWEGDVGKDPWGTPYHFAFIRNAQGTPTHVAVWSDGPNHKSDTTGTKGTGLSPDAVKFGGDDLGTITSIR